MSLAAISGLLKTTFQVTGQASQSGFNNSVWPANFSANAAISALGAAVKGEANAFHAVELTIGTSSTVSLDLTSLTNLLGTFNLARVKAIVVYHDAGSVASSVKWDLTVSNSLLGWFSSGITITLLPGEQQTIGGLTANGQAVSGSHKIVAITNNDASNAATVWVGIIGATS